jgi:hypothetical protein
MIEHPHGWGDKDGVVNREGNPDGAEFGSLHRPVAAGIFIGSACGLLVAVALSVLWPPRIDHSATIDLWIGTGRSLHALQWAYGDREDWLDSLMRELVGPEVLADVVDDLDLDSRWRGNRQKAIARLGEGTEVTHVIESSAIEITVTDREEGQARELVEAMGKACWERVIRQRVEDAMEAQEAREAEIERDKATLDDWIHRLHEILAEEDARPMGLLAPGPYSSTMEQAWVAYYETDKKLWKLKMELVNTGSGLRFMKHRAGRPFSVEMSAQVKQRNAVATLLFGVAGGGVIGMLLGLGVGRRGLGGGAIQAPAASSRRSG